MKCNKCWKDVDMKMYYVVSKCKHLFCYDCASKAWGSGSEFKCPLCQLPLTEDDISRNDTSDVESIAQQLFGISVKNLFSVNGMLSNFAAKQQALYESKLSHDKKVVEKKANSTVQQITAKAVDYRKQREQLKSTLTQYKEQNSKMETQIQQFKKLMQDYERDKKQTKDYIFRMTQEKKDDNGQKSIVSNGIVQDKPSKFSKVPLFKPKPSTSLFSNTSKIELKKTERLKPKKNENTPDKFEQIRNMKQLPEKSRDNIFSIRRKDTTTMIQSPIVNTKLFTSPLRSVVIPFTPL
ncbi:RING-type domain-containing protein [Entamoeba marina]